MTPPVSPWQKASVGQTPPDGQEPSPSSQNGLENAPVPDVWRPADSPETTSITDTLGTEFVGRRSALFWLALKTGALTILSLWMYRFWMKLDIPFPASPHLVPYFVEFVVTTVKSLCAVSRVKPPLTAPCYKGEHVTRPQKDQNSESAFHDYRPANPADEAAWKTANYRIEGWIRLVASYRTKRA